MKLTGIFKFTHATVLLATLLAGLVMPAKGAGISSGTNNANEDRVAEKRDPFWPVGYTPKQSMRSAQQGSSGAAPVSSSWDEAMKKVVINGVSSRKDNESFAVINGDVKRVGDTVSIRLGNLTYTWAVDGIESKGSVKLRRMSVR